MNRLALGTGATSYLEVGVGYGTTFSHVRVASRTGMDPNPKFDPDVRTQPGVALLDCTSDEFFSEVPPSTVFDLIFIDGLHTFDQAYRDFCSSLLHTHLRSVIVLDDTRPSDAYSALPDHQRALRLRSASGNSGRDWHGDVFKVLFAIHDFHPGLAYATIMEGNPWTLVWRATTGRREPAIGSLEAISRLTYFDLLDRAELLHPATEEEALSRCLADLARIGS